MNYYERIQHSIDFIEDHLFEDFTVEMCAKEAYMSVSGFYRMFLSIVGYNVKEYIRLRRLTCAYYDLIESPDTVLDISIKYGYTSSDSFTRAFKKRFGVLPSKVKHFSSQETINKFARLNIMEQYFETENHELEEKYPDIKVIRELPDLKVACYTYFGKDPEDHAFAIMKEWAKTHNVPFHEDTYRIFGYNNPDPSNVDDFSELYGYEVCITISDEQYEALEDVPSILTKESYPCVKRRILRGGKYAVMSVKRDETGDIGTPIMAAWKRFNLWISESKYLWGGNQYLEEHLGFSDDDDHIGGVNLYISIKDTPNIILSKKEQVTIPTCNVAVFKSEGNDKDSIAIKAWDNALTFAKQNHLDSNFCKIYQYNKGFDIRPPYFHVVMITLPDTFDIHNCITSSAVSFEVFLGGTYLCVETTREQLMDTWMRMEQWRKETKMGYAKHQWVEEWCLENWAFPEKKLKVCYPILNTI